MSGRDAESAPQAVIMAGGEGRRLGALTSVLPKPMLPIGDRPLLQAQIELLRDQGIRRIALSVRYRAKTIIDYFGDGHWLGVRLHYLAETESLGTAGALGLLPPWPEPLLVLNGDIVADIPVQPLLRHHADYRADITVCCAEYALPVPYGVVDGNYPLVSELREKPSLTVMVNAGVYVLSPSMHDFVRPARLLQMPELVDKALAEGCVASYRLPGPWIDIGTPEQYALACGGIPQGEGRLIVSKLLCGQRARARVGSSQIPAPAVGDRRDQ
jgi:NDP-sugar pyrophosphorylase family protein